MGLITTLLNRLAFPHWRIVLLAFALVSCVYGGWHARGIVEQASQAEQLRAMAEKRRKQEEDAYRQSAALEEKLAAMQAANRQLNRRLAHETSKPEYSCPLPAGGLQIRSRALADTPRESDASLPRTH